MTDAAQHNDLPFDDARQISGLMGLALDAEEAEADSGSDRFVAPLPDELAAKFPSLEILERVGSGGMGCVYKARQKHLDRLVALKILPAELGRDPRFTERFTREGRALAKLVHPNIVTIHDFGQVDGLYFIVMEYMDGMSLRELMNVEQPGDIDVVKVMTDICSALQYAHEAGIVHRDIKPENILFNRRGHLKIADFGLVKLAVQATQDVSLTGSRQAMGTLHYMAPEQWEDPHNVDHRADLYALGVLLYELVTGRLPLGHFDPPSVLASADPAIDDVVMGAMQSNPEQRYQSADELAAAVKGLGDVTPARGHHSADNGGTFTRFANVGGRMRRIANKVAQHAETESGGFPWVTALWLLAIFMTSFGGGWVGGADAFESSIPGVPIDVPNFLPFAFAAGVFGIRLFPGRLGRKGDCLTILLCAAGIAHVVSFYVFWAEAAPGMVSLQAKVSVLPGVVGFLMAICLLEQIWSLFTQFCVSIADGARAIPWRSWVNGMNQKASEAHQKMQAHAKSEKERKVADHKNFFQQLRSAGVGPSKMWDALGVEAAAKSSTSASDSANPNDGQTTNDDAGTA